MGAPRSHPLDTPLWFGSSASGAVTTFGTGLGTPWMPQGGEGGVTHWISRNARFSTSFTLYLRLNLEKKGESG